MPFNMSDFEEVGDGSSAATTTLNKPAKPKWDLGDFEELNPPQEQVQQPAEPVQPPTITDDSFSRFNKTLGRLGGAAKMPQINLPEVSGFDITKPPAPVKEIVSEDILPVAKETPSRGVFATETPTVIGNIREGKFADAAGLAKENVMRFLRPVFGPTEQQKIAESIPVTNEKGETSYEFRPADTNAFNQYGVYGAVKRAIPSLERGIPVTELDKAVEGEMYEADPKDSTLKSIAKGLFNATHRTVVSLSDPTLLALPQSRAISAAFSLDMANSAREQFQKAADSENTQDAVENLLGGVVSLTMAGAAGKHAAFEGKPTQADIVSNMDKVPDELLHEASKELQTKNPEVADAANSELLRRARDLGEELSTVLPRLPGDVQDRVNGIIQKQLDGKELSIGDRATLNTVRSYAAKVAQEPTAEEFTGVPKETPPPPTTPAGQEEQVKTGGPSVNPPIQGGTSNAFKQAQAEQVVAPVSEAAKAAAETSPETAKAAEETARILAEKVQTTSSKFPVSNEPVPEDTHIVAPVMADENGNIIYGGKYGQTHSDLITEAAKNGIDATEAQHAFVDNNGKVRYRDQAWEIAKNAGQIPDSYLKGVEAGAIAPELHSDIFKQFQPSAVEAPAMGQGEGEIGAGKGSVMEPPLPQGEREAEPPTNETKSATPLPPTEPVPEPPAQLLPEKTTQPAAPVETVPTTSGDTGAVSDELKFNQRVEKYVGDYREALVAEAQRMGIQDPEAAANDAILNVAKGPETQTPYGLLKRQLTQIRANEMRAASAEKRGGGEKPLSMDEARDEEGRTLGETVPSEEPSPRTEASQAERKSAVMEEVGKLSEREQKIINDYHFEGKTFEEIGKDLGISKQAVQQSYQKALGKLKEQMSSEEYAGGPGAMGPVEALENEAKLKKISIKNELVDKARQELGLPEREQPLRRAYGPLWDEARAKFDSDPNAGVDLIKSLKNKTRPLTDLEDAILTHEQLDRQAIYDNAVERVNNATPEELPEAKAALRAARDAMYEVYEVGQKAGTENARGLAARRMMVREDYSLAKMEARMRAANDGKPLEGTKFEKNYEFLKDADEKLKKLEAEHAEVLKAAQEGAAFEEMAHIYEQMVKEGERELAKQPKVSKTILDLAKKWVDALDKKADAARERIRQRTGRTFAGVDPVVVLDVAEIMASHIGHVGLKFAEVSARVLDEFGNDFKPYLKKAWVEAKKIINNQGKEDEKGGKSKPDVQKAKEVVKKGTPKEAPTVPEIKAKAKAEAAAGDELSQKLIYDLAKAHIKAGVHGQDNLMKAVHADLKESFPDVTESDIRVAFTNYGRAKFPSQDVVKTELRELNNLWRLQESIERLKSGRDALKTGLQRDKATQAIREKQKELNELLKKRQGPPSPEKLASIDEARQTAIKNRIADIEKELRTGERSGERVETPRSAKTEDLMMERDALMEKLREVRDAAKPKLTEADLKAEEAQKAVDRAAAALDRQQRINSGEFTPEPKEKAQPLSELEKELRDRTDELRKAKRAADAEKNKPTPEEDAAAKAQKGVDAAAASVDYWDRVLKGELERGKSTTKEPLTNLQEELLAQADAMRRAADEIRKQPRSEDEKRAAKEEQLIKQMEKSQAEYERRAKEMDFSEKGQTQNRPDTQRIAKAREARDAAKKAFEDLKKAQEVVKTPEERYNETRLKAVKKQIDELNRRLHERDFAPKPKAEPKQKTQELLKIEQQRDRIKREVDKKTAEVAAANRTRSQKFWDTFVGVERGMKLSSDIVLAKLTLAALAREAALTPAEEAVGGIFSKALPALAARAPREGGLSLKAEMRAKAAVFTKGMEDAWNNLKMRESELESTYGRKEAKPPPKWYEYFGFLHAALKSPVKRAEFERSLTKRMEHAVRNGENLDDISTVRRLSEEAYVDANRSIFMQDNVLSDMFRAAINRGKNSKTSPNFGPAAARIAEFLVPIVKVPTNIVGEVATGATGLPVGAVRAAHAYLKGIENLPPAQADAIMRQLKKGAIGASLILFGAFAHNQIGGYYQSGEKRSKSDVQPDNYRIGGVDLPSWFGHSTAAMLMNLGATYARKYEKEQNRLMATRAAAGGLTENLPLIPAVTDLQKALETDRGLEHWVMSMITSTFTPGLTQHLAKVADTPGTYPSNILTPANKRKPETVGQALEMGIPGMRQNVPLKEETGSQVPAYRRKRSPRHWQ